MGGRVSIVRDRRRLDLLCLRGPEALRLRDTSVKSVILDGF